MNTTHSIVHGDARQMDTVADSSVQLVVTSPPYWQIKDYGSEEQIGYNHSYEDYINNLNLVWQECHRILDGGCRLCINIGDQFARAVYYGRYKVIPIKTEIIKFCEIIGFDYMGTIIWQKQTTMNTSGGGSVMGSYPYPRNGIIKIDYESILLFKKNGRSINAAADKKTKAASKLTHEEWNTYFTGHWHFKGEKQDKHIAMFPVELPHRLIKMFSFVGDTVLDPFLGSGTTSLAAINLRRNSIGYEINRDFLPVIRRKTGNGVNLISGATVQIVQHTKNKPPPQTWQARIARLPYVFSDEVKIERKIDPKKVTFGSKIDANGSGMEKDRYYQVKDILSPNKLRLSDGVAVRLIGVAPLRKKTHDAMQFIQNKTKGQKVFIKFDAKTYDREGNLLCYLYLSNKTFINAHLIKSGLALADKTAKHKYVDKFIKYQEAACG